ncbi:MAG: BON domain-containing protein [Caldanaerobacter sp.]|uniref:BON domain-containing protein n=1 Tax=Caldanaerobacter sp. TaxID=2930036 RepID=UPI003C714076
MKTNEKEKDQLIVNSVIQKLSRYDLNLPDLVITADNGIIMLKGYVKNSEQKKLLSQIAESVEGVKEIINEVKIR